MSFNSKLSDYAGLMNLFLEFEQELEEVELEQTEPLNFDAITALDKKLESILDGNELSIFRRLMGTAFVLEKQKKKLLSWYGKIAEQNRLIRHYLSPQAKVQMLKDSGLSGARPSVDIEDFKLMRAALKFEMAGKGKGQAFTDALKDAEAYTPRTDDDNLPDAAKKKKDRIRGRRHALYDSWK